MSNDAVDRETPPISGYEQLGAREVMRAILDLPVDQLQRLHTYEELHRRRAHVLSAIRRTIARAGGHPRDGAPHR